jgi:hypothetical protein
MRRTATPLNSSQAKIATAAIKWRIVNLSPFMGVGLKFSASLPQAMLAALVE